MLKANYLISQEQDGLLKFVQEGFWDEPMALRFVNEARDRIGRARETGPVRLVIDATRFQTPSSHVSDILGRFDSDTRQDGDRIAMIVNSSLLRIQMKRQIQKPGLEIFLSAGDAEAWVRS